MMNEPMKPKNVAARLQTQLAAQCATPTEAVCIAVQVMRIRVNEHVGRNFGHAQLRQAPQFPRKTLYRYQSVCAVFLSSKVPPSLSRECRSKTMATPKPNPENSLSTMNTPAAIQCSFGARSELRFLRLLRLTQAVQQEVTQLAGQPCCKACYTAFCSACLNSQTFHAV